MMINFSSVQSLSRVRLFATPWIVARQASLSITNSRICIRIVSVLPINNLANINKHNRGFPEQITESCFNNIPQISLCFIVIQFEIFLIFLVISYLTHIFDRYVLFNFQRFKVFLNILLLHIFNSTLLGSENILCKIPIMLSVLRHVMAQHTLWWVYWMYLKTVCILQL